MVPDMNRREFIKESLLATAGGALALGAAEQAMAQGNPAAAPKSAAPLAAPACPMGKIGKLQLSRLIMGSNLITFYIHSRDLKYINNLARHYLNEEKILETLAAAERYGINTIMTQDDDRYLGILRKYRDQRGGKLQWVIAPQLTNDPAVFKDRVKRLAMDGVAAMYIHGNQADPLAKDGNREAIAAALEEIKLADVPAGIACHDLNVVQFCEKSKLEPDFYLKTFHHHNYPTAPKPEQIKGPYAEIPGYWCHNPVETAAVMKEVARPFIAYKVMAAGAIPPADAFKYSFQHGADFILAGMFDFEIEEDVRHAREAHAAAATRERPWRG